MPRAQSRRPPPEFDPVPHERELVAIIEEIADSPGCAPRALGRILRRHPKAGRGLFSRSEIIAGFRRFAPERGWEVGERDLAERLRLRPVRTQSGVTPVSVLTRPHPCPGACIFCPSDPGMPKSYLADEPGAQRAADNGFDPYLQTWNRIETFRRIGHPVDKVELIVLGGTWSAHPEPYQVGYLKRCLDALNDFGRGADGRAESGAEEASWSELERAQRENQTAGCRCVGLSVETRPDCVSPDEALRLRRLGATKVQIGIQSLSDRVLQLNRRGHTVADTRRALRLLRAAGFKLHAHWMPNLYGSSPAADVAEYRRLFDDPDFCPDELKIYPCSLIESAELMDLYRRGDWRPYTREELLGVLTACLRSTPPYCRITRVIRDFSAADIAAGNKTSNLREVAEAELREAGGVCRDIRSREIRGAAFRREALHLTEIEYPTSVGEEVFLQFVTPEDRLVAFLRLSLPRERCSVDEIDGSALLREVHVYGASLAIGRPGGRVPQHLGLGRELIERAAARARAAGFASLAVISAIGTRAYYRGLGFRDGPLYQHLELG